MKSIVMFENVEELLALTGLKTRDELWEAGFNLDDWDIGFCTKTTIEVDSWLEMQMNNYCCGYRMTQYKDKYFYMVYHS